MRFTRIILLLGSLVIFVPGRAESFTNLLTGTDLLPTSVLIASTNDPAIDWRGVTFGAISNQLANGWKQDATNASSGAVAAPAEQIFMGDAAYSLTTTAPHYNSISGYSGNGLTAGIGAMFFPRAGVLTNFVLINNNLPGAGTNLWATLATNAPGGSAVSSHIWVNLTSVSRIANSGSLSLSVSENTLVQIRLTNDYGNAGNFYISSAVTFLPQ